MDERAIQGIVHRSLLSSAFRRLSEPGRRAMYEACERRTTSVPEAVATELDDAQAKLVAGLMADDDGRKKIRAALDAVEHERTWGTLH